MRYRNEKLLVLAALILSACHPATGTKAAPSSASALPALPIEPPSLGKLSPIELSALVFDAKPKYGADMGWDHMLDAPIQWTTNGTEQTETGLELRTGKARVRIGGRVSTLLKQVREEVPWTVTLEGQIIRQPDSIEIKAGGDGDDACFGSLAQN